MGRFGDFAAAFAAGVAKGAPAGYELGLKGRELEETRKYRESETKRKAEADYQKNLRAIEKQMDTAQHQKIMGAAATRNAATSAADAVSKNTRRQAQTAQGETRTAAKVAETISTIRKNAGWDPAFEATKKPEDRTPDPAAHLLGGAGGAVGATTPAPTIPAPTTQAPVDEFDDDAYMEFNGLVEEPE